MATAASVQLSAAIPNFATLEYAVPPEEFMKVVKHPTKQVDGYFAIPETPGLGIELDEEVMKQFPYIEKSYRGEYYWDGGIADV